MICVRNLVSVPGSFLVGPLDLAVVHPARPALGRPLVNAIAPFATVYTPLLFFSKGATNLRARTSVPSASHRPPTMPLVATTCVIAVYQAHSGAAIDGFKQNGRSPATLNVRSLSCPLTHSRIPSVQTSERGPSTPLAYVEHSSDEYSFFLLFVGRFASGGRSILYE